MLTETPTVWSRQQLLTFGSQAITKHGFRDAYAIDLSFSPVLVLEHDIGLPSSAAM